MIHLVCNNCNDHFFSGELDKEYKCPFCQSSLHHTSTSTPADLEAAEHRA
ncbi:hypothetical protein [Aneurinibacillus tyrosinisolvens]|nr:hypothetical protein [Aneurinibacillus tyrosinisolvens]